MRETKVEKKRDLECRRRRRNGAFCVTANVTTGSILLVFFKTPSSVSLFCVFCHSLCFETRTKKESKKGRERERERSLLSLSFSEEEEEEEEEKCVVLFPLFSLVSKM